MFKFHQSALSKSELRMIRVFRGVDLPGTSNIEGPEEDSPSPPLDKAEVYVCYAHIKASGWFGGGKKEEGGGG